MVISLYHRVYQLKTPHNHKLHIKIDFDLFTSNVYHFVKLYGKDYIDILVQENDIRAYDFMRHKAQSLYLLGMLDHLCHKYEVPLKEEYADLRKTSLDSYLYTKSVN